MDKDMLFGVPSPRKDDEEMDETFYDRVARLRRIQKEAAERVARRYADIKPEKQGRWRVGGLNRPEDRETPGLVR